MRKEIAGTIGILIANIDRIIEKIKEKSIIERVGTDKKGYWKVNLRKL